MPVYKHNKPTADGRIWRFQVSYKADGKYKQYKSGLFATKKEAERAEAQWIVDNKSGTPKYITINDLIPEFLAEKKATTKPQTYDREVVLCSHVSRLIGGVVVNKLTATQYEYFRQQLLESSWSVSYKNKINKELKSLLDYADRKHDIRNDIPKKYKAFSDPAPAKDMQIYTLDEFRRFIEKVDSPIYQAYFTFLMFTGTRMNEANALTWNDISFEKKTASINKSIVAKTKTKDGLFAVTSPKTKASVRVIPLAENVLKCLKTLPREDDTDFVFGGKRPLPETTITKKKDKAAAEAGLHRIRVHDFRHSYTSMLVNNLGVDNILLISKLLGHSNVQETLKTYSHLWSSALDDYVKKINDLPTIRP